MTDESELVTLVRESPMTSEELDAGIDTDFEALTSTIQKHWFSGATGVVVAFALLATGLTVGVVAGLMAAILFFRRHNRGPRSSSQRATSRTAIHLDGDAVSRIVNLTPAKPMKLK